MSDFPTEECQIKRNIDGHTGEDGNWVPGGEYLVATAEIDIQPKSGQERVTELQTKYESDHIGFIGNEDIIYTEGFDEILEGDTLETDIKKYIVAFVPDWDSHVELNLKYKGRLNNGT